MKHTKLILAAFALFVMAGCAAPADPTQRLRVATVSATFTLNTIANARDAGLIKQSDIDPYRPYVEAFMAAQAEAERELRAGETDHIQAALAQVEAAAVPLAPLLAKIEAAKKGTK